MFPQPHEENLIFLKFFGFGTQIEGEQNTVFTCIDRYFSSIEVELDAKVIFDILVNLICSNFVVHAIMDDYKQMASQIPKIHFKHYFRKANRCADKLARIGAYQDSDFILFNNPPCGLD